MISRRLLLRLSAGLALGLAGGPALAEIQRPVRFGLTAVVVRENLPFFKRWSTYLEARIGRPVEFVLRRTYREIMHLLETGDLDFAWICGFPYARRREPEYLELLAVPVFQGLPLYRSYIIVHRDALAGGLDDLRGRVFAFSDPDSNSGYLVPRAMLMERRLPPDKFFRLTFFTYNHAETIEAVADKFADAGAVDSYVWEYVSHSNPGLAGRTRVVARSQLFGFPPLVARRTTDRVLLQRMAEALHRMHEEPDGRDLLAELEIDRLIPGDPTLYDGIRQMADRLSASRAPEGR